MKTLDRIRFRRAVSPRHPQRRYPSIRTPSPLRQYECGHPRGSRRNRFLKGAVSQTPTANKNKTQTMKGLLC